MKGKIWDIKYLKACKYAGKHSSNMNVNSWIMSFRFRKSFLLWTDFVHLPLKHSTQILSDPHKHQREREREREREERGERETCEDKINRAYSLTIHCHCDTFCILIPSKALHSLKWLSSTLLCFDPLIFMKHCLMPVIQIWQEFHFGFMPVVQNQQHLNALVFPDCKHPPI